MKYILQHKCRTRWIHTLYSYNVEYIHFSWWFLSSVCKKKQERSFFGTSCTKSFLIGRHIHWRLMNMQIAYCWQPLTATIVFAWKQIMCPRLKFLLRNFPSSSLQTGQVWVSNFLKHSSKKIWPLWHWNILSSGISQHTLHSFFKDGDEAILTKS